MVIGRARPLQGCNHIATHRERALPRIISESRLIQSRYFHIYLAYETIKHIIEIV
jgi:hypothetical protein